MKSEDMNLKQVNERMAALDIEVRTMYTNADTEAQAMTTVADMEARKITLNADVSKLDTEKQELRIRQDELTEMVTRQQTAQALTDGSITPKVIEIRKEITKMDEKETKVAESEIRGKALLEKRAVTIASTGIILPAHQATDIKPTFNEVSSLLDRVTIKNLLGGESYQQPYLTGYGEGEYATENDTTLTDADATFAYATINKTKIVAYTEDSEELVKLPAANFDAEVVKGVTVAERKKITKEILIGDGTTGHFVGIFDDQATAIDAATDIDFAEIDENTLDEIVYSYGGDEDVEDVAVLILNKLDLKAFSLLRDANGNKIYNIIPKGNTGTINLVPYIINSNCKAISAAATTTGQYCMAYGLLSYYVMAVFSNLEVSRSTDYKFKEGMIAHRAVIFAGGNVAGKNGFLRVKRT